MNHQTPTYHSTKLGTSEGDISFPSSYCFSMPKEYQDLLVHATLMSTTSSVCGNLWWCVGTCRYKTCPILQIMDTFASNTTAEQFAIKVHTSCKTPNVIYLIAYKRCGLQYVGKTVQPLHCWMNGDRFNIAHRRTEESPVAVHFNSLDHTEADLSVMITGRLCRNDNILREIRESRWINSNLIWVLR